MDERCAIRLRFGRNQHGRQFCPFDRDIRQVEVGDSITLRGHNGDRLAAKTRHAFGQRRLVGKGRNDAEAVFTRNVGSGVDADDAGPGSCPCLEITESEAGVVMRRAHDQHGQRIGEEGIAAERFDTGDFRHAVQPSDARADSMPGGRQTGAGAGHSTIVRRIHHRRDDLAVAGAAAEHAAKGILHFAFARMRHLLQQRRAGDQQAGRADAALRRAVREKGRLQGRQRAVSQPFHRRHRRAVHRGCRRQAGADRFAVEQHGAGAAIAGVAADLCAGEA